MIVKMDQSDSNKKRILVIDDRGSDSQLVKLYLDRANRYIVREVNDAKVAVTAAEAFHPDLILLDVMMPGIDGGELAAAFATNPKLSAVPIVFLTAAITKDEVEAGRGLVGGRPYLAKPVVLTELVTCIEKQLGTPVDTRAAKAV